MTDVQTLLNRTPAGDVCTLDPIRYDVDVAVIVRNGKRLQLAAGTVIHLNPTTARNAPVVRLQGDGATIAGGTLLGNATGGAFQSAFEAQHAIALEGAVDATIDHVKIRNVFGDGVYLGTTDGTPQGGWCQGARILRLDVDGARHYATVNAAADTLITAGTVGHVMLGVVDVEPPGRAWGCTNLRWTDTDVYDRAGGFVFANKGDGTGNTVHDIVLDGIRCHNRTFNVGIAPPGDTRTRRHDYTIQNCTGAGIMNGSPIVARHIDRLTVANIAQPMSRGVHLVEAIDCTQVLVNGIAA